MTFKNDNKVNSNLSANLDKVAYGNKVRFREPDAADSRSRKQCDVCFSLSNLALIVASITGLFFLIVFFYDDPLYSNLEMLFSTTFFRQLVFITVIIPLVLLIPIFNAISGLFLQKPNQLYKNFSILIVKIVYISVLAIVVFIGIIFMIPYVNDSSVINKLDLEFLFHMSHRYGNSFSLSFLDTIQQSYQCCDTKYYRANPQEFTLPYSCLSNPATLEPYYETCPLVIGRLVSLRCKFIAASLCVILISLLALVIIGICELMGQEYNVANREEHYRRMKGVQGMRHIDDDLIDEPQDDAGKIRTPPSNSPVGHNRPITPNIEEDIIGDEISDRLRLAERERETPLLSNHIRVQDMERRSERPTPLLTRAYFTSIDDHKRRSPSFVDSIDQTKGREDLPRRQRSSHSPSKSSIKRGLSNGIIDSDIEPEETESVHEYLRETRKSTMNVRFNIK